MNFRTGALPAVRPAALKDLAVYGQGPIWTPPTQVAVPSAPAGYPIDGNATYGCCTVDGVVHLKEAWHAKYGLPYTPPTEQLIENVYFRLTGGADTGLVEANVLKEWQTKGLFGSTLAAYAPIQPHDLLGIHQAIAYYDGAYLGIEVGRPQQEQFQRGEPWTYTGANEEDGHCVVALGYNKNGELEVATWGGIATLTAGFLAHQLREAWCLISGILVTRKADLLGINIAALRADCASV